MNFSTRLLKKLNYRFIICLTCLVATATGFAGVNEQAPADSLTASKVFAEIPLQVLDMLRPSTRLDMLDYYEHADSLLTVTDALGGQSRLEVVTPDYLKVSVTPVSTLEIKLLPVKKGTLIMTLYTVGTAENASNEQRATSNAPTASDTEIQFFDATLTPLPTEKFLKSPSLKNFFNLNGKDLKESDLYELIPFQTIEYATGPGSVPLTATLTTLSTLSDETRSLLQPLLIPSLSSPWKSSFHFK